MKNRLELSIPLKQFQRLIASREMQKALHLLQLPVMELSSLIASELEENPILEYSEEEERIEASDILRQFEEEFRIPTSLIHKEGEDLKAFVENTIAYEESLFDALMRQAREAFTKSDELRLANALIGNFDENGFLSVSLEEIALFEGVKKEALEPILNVIQTFDPAGVGACTPQESMLIQLRRANKENSLSYRLVEQHFEEMIHNKLPQIAKSIKESVEKIRAAIENEIALLDFHPGAIHPHGHYREFTQSAIPDLFILLSPQSLTIEVNEKSIPAFKINHSYLKMLMSEELPKETREYIRSKILSGKWLLRNLFERQSTLYKIAEQLVERQKEFLLSAKGKLAPLTMKEVAETLSLHESTIARAVANKYVSTPRGTMALRSFFTNAYTTKEGEQISAKTVKELLQELVEKESRSHPHSDEKLSELLQAKGVSCARRTVAKYRKELGIGSTPQRRMHTSCEAGFNDMKDITI